MTLGQLEELSNILARQMHTLIWEAAGQMSRHLDPPICGTF
jgi:hypothetical protein